MRAGGPRTQVTTGGSRSPRRRAASTCGPEARVPRWQRAVAEAPDGAPLPHAGRRLAYPAGTEAPDGVPLPHAGRRPAYPGDNRRQPKTQTACHFNVRAGGPRTQVAAGGSRRPRRRATSTCGPEARVPQWQRGSSVADACGSSLSRHPRTVPQSKNLSHRPGNVDDQDGFMVR